MEESTINPIQQTVACPACATEASAGEAFCTACGYPFEGTEQEQRYFLSVRESKAIDLDEANKKIKKAGNILYLIAAATVIMGFIAYARGKNMEARQLTMIINMILAGIYAALGAWSRKKPLTAIISGFSLYVLILLLNAVVSPITILSGIIIKIIFIGFFIRGIKSAIEVEKIKKELNIE
jgi:hypothetical protein